MDIQKLTINELALRVTEEMTKLGLSLNTIWCAYNASIVQIVRLHEKKNKKYYNRSIVTEYVRSVKKRKENGELTDASYRRLMRGAERLTELHDTGKLEWSCPGKVSKYKLTEYYENVIDEFIAAGEWHPNTLGDVTWVARKFFAWLIQEKIENLCDVGAVEIQRFMINCAEHLRTNTMHDIQLYMRKICRYLFESGQLYDSYEALLSFKVSRESKMQPAISQDEAALILDMIDRCTVKGKRDYAIILLGIVTGLRAVDIAKLRLSDIDWKTGEIKIVQSKTGRSLALPLTKDVGEAIKDYVLNGRRRTASEFVFLRDRAPFNAFVNGVAIGNLYDSYRLKAGLPRDAFDGKGFHALRRSMGKNLVAAGTPVTTVAQVLGVENIDSTKKYISLDSKHLIECALDFAGIEGEAANE